MARKQISRRDYKADETIRALPLACQDEAAAVEFLEAKRWGDTPTCPRCGSTDVYKMMGKDGQRQANFRWLCRECRRGKRTHQYTVRIGTVFEDSAIDLRHWCYAFWRAATSKKGVAALEIQRQTGITYKSALFMMHRIRFAMAPDPEVKLSGTVEVDETYVGGKPRYKKQGKRGRGTSKQPVMALVERGGNVRTQVVPNVTARTLKNVIRRSVDPTATIVSDENSSYRGIGAEFEGGHFTVRHGAGEYVRGEIHSNTIEGFFSRVKRGLNGVNHAVSRRHLPLYLNHWGFLHNHRALGDGERVVEVIKATQGKRLLYREPLKH